MTDNPGVTPGPIVFLGSGETGKVGGQVFETLAQRLEKPLRVDVLETPAGFELNSAQVAGRVAEFVGARLQNYPNEVAVIAARGKNSDFSPDNPALLQPMLSGNLFFMGPGSPTYAVKHLSGSLAWHILLARHRLGAGLVLASAAAIAAGAWALPVYEIYKVGTIPAGAQGWSCWRHLACRWWWYRIGITRMGEASSIPAGVLWARNGLKSSRHSYRPMLSSWAWMSIPHCGWTWGKRVARCWAEASCT